jgi:CRP-like cAMP-binding protein
MSGRSVSISGTCRFSLTRIRFLQKAREAADHGRARSAFLGALEERTLRKLTDHGYLLSVRAGQVVTRTGLVQQELFVIVCGTFRVSDGARSPTLSPGEVFGEVGFFGGSHQRSATVIAETDGALLVIGRRWLEQLKGSDPKASAEVLFELARAMADRLYGH